MPKYNHFLQFWGWRFHHTNLGGHNPVHDKPTWDFTGTCPVDSKLYLEHGRLKNNQETLIKNTSDQEFAFPWCLQMYQEAMIIQGWVDGMRG